jgi:ubiquitin-like protein Nedd8
MRACKDGLDAQIAESARLRAADGLPMKVGSTSARSAWEVALATTPLADAAATFSAFHRGAASAPKPRGCGRIVTKKVPLTFVDLFDPSATFAAVAATAAVKFGWVERALADGSSPFVRLRSAPRPNVAPHPPSLPASFCATFIDACATFIEASVAEAVSVAVSETRRARLTTVLTNRRNGWTRPRLEGGFVVPSTSVFATLRPAFALSAAPAAAPASAPAAGAAPARGGTGDVVLICIHDQRTGGSIELDVRSGDTVLGVKRVLATDHGGVAPQHQRLVFEGSVLDDDDTVQTAGLDAGTTVMWMQTAPEAADAARPRIARSNSQTPPSLPSSPVKASQAQRASAATSAASFLDGLRLGQCVASSLVFSVLVWCVWSVPCWLLAHPPSRRWSLRTHAAFQVHRHLRRGGVRRERKPRRNVAR